jgi:hypothetical protein
VLGEELRSLSSSLCSLLHKADLDTPVLTIHNIRHHYTLHRLMCCYELLDAMYVYIRGGPKYFRNVNSRPLKTFPLKIQGVPPPTKPGSSLIIPKPIKLLQRDLNRSTFVGEKWRWMCLQCA